MIDFFALHMTVVGPALIALVGGIALAFDVFVIRPRRWKQAELQRTRNDKERAESEATVSSTGQVKPRIKVATSNGNFIGDTAFIGDSDVSVR